MKPLLTIGIPTYNRAAVLARSLETILARSLSCDPSDYEILIIDDGSTDETPRELDRLREQYPTAPFRVLRNEPKLTYDENAYRIYAEAKGAFLWFCSDRFFYNVDIGLVLGIISNHPNVQAITFSDLLRRVYPPAPGHRDDLELIQDDGVLQKLGGEFHRYKAHRYFLTSVDRVIQAEALYGGAGALFDATPDCIVRVNHSAEWMKTYREFIGSFNVFQAGMLEPFLHTGTEVAFIQFLSFCEYAHRSASGGNRHDWLAMIEYEPVFQRVFPFFPSTERRQREAHRVLLDFYMYQRAERDMVIPVTKAQIDEYCRSRSYSPSAAIRFVTWLFARDLPQSYHRTLRSLVRRTVDWKRRFGIAFR